MTLTIREGGFYRTRDGQKVGPIINNSHFRYIWSVEPRDPHILSWSAEGAIFGEGHPSGHDLIAEWVDEPAQTIRVGSKWKYVKPSTAFYTSGKVYEVIYVPVSEWPVRVTDDGSFTHWTREGFMESFVPDVADEPALPVRTVTHLEVIDGTCFHMDRKALRAAARVFNSLAEALEDQQ